MYRDKNADEIKLKSNTSSSLKNEHFQFELSGFIPHDIGRIEMTMNALLF